MSLYLNGTAVKCCLVKYNHNDYEKVLAGDENVSITIPSSAAPISNALKGVNNCSYTYSGSASGKPWGATNMTELLSDVTLTFTVSMWEKDLFTSITVNGTSITIPTYGGPDTNVVVPGGQPCTIIATATLQGYESIAMANNSYGNNEPPNWWIYSTGTGVQSISKTITPTENTTIYLEEMQ